MLEVALVSQSSVKRLHARREALTLVIIEVSESDLVSVFWRLYFGEIEIDRVMISKIDDKLTKPLILQNGWQELVSAGQLCVKLVLELGSCNYVEVADVNVDEASVQVHLSVAHEAQRVLEWHLDVLLGVVVPV